MVRFLLLILFILIRPLHADTYEEFYILPMGQGNAQLVIYVQGAEKIGVLYDLGSKSLQTHPKFMNRGKWDQKYKSKQVIGKRSIQSFPSTPTKNNLQITSNELQTPEPVTGGSSKVSEQAWTIDGKLKPSQQKTHKKNLELFIYDLLHDLSHLFIFLSHSDQDHICYLNQNAIPDTVPLTILFCGDWFGKDLSHL